MSPLTMTSEDSNLQRDGAAGTPPLAFSDDWTLYKASAAHRGGDSNDPKVPSNASPKLWKCFNIITGYIRSDETMTEHDTVIKLVDFYNPEGRNWILLSSIFTAAHQIPYDHARHRKLAALVYAIDDSPARLTKSASTDEDWLKVEFMGDIEEVVSDWQDNPLGRVQDGRPVESYANMQAFLASMMSLGNRFHASHFMAHAVFIAFYIYDRRARSDDTTIRQTAVIGAAQWFLWDIDAAWEVWTNRTDGVCIPPAWSDWAFEFRLVAAGAPGHGERSRDIARQAMEAIQLKLEGRGDPLYPDLADDATVVPGFMKVRASV